MNLRWTERFEVFKSNECTTGLSEPLLHHSLFWPITDPILHVAHFGQITSNSMGKLPHHRVKKNLEFSIILSASS